MFGEDFDYIQVDESVPQAAEFAVRIQGDSMIPVIADGSVAYVNRDPLRAGDVGIFCVDGDMFCKQYYKDPAGVVYLFSLNRARARCGCGADPRMRAEPGLPWPGDGAYASAAGKKLKKSGPVRPALSCSQGKPSQRESYWNCGKTGDGSIQAFSMLQMRDRSRLSR